MLICIVRNNLTGGLVVFDNVTPKELSVKTKQLYGVQLEKGERNPSGNVGISCRRVPMMDREREIFNNIYIERLMKTETHDSVNSYFIRSW